MVPPGYLEARRAVFGGKHLRALLKLGGDATAGAAPTDKPKLASIAAAPLVPAYLPERLAEDLPRFRAGQIAEVRLAACSRWPASPRHRRATRPPAIGR